VRCNSWWYCKKYKNYEVKNMALAEIQKRKLKVAFESYDFDGNGVLDKEDLERAAVQTSKIKDLKVGTTEEKKVESAYTVGWDDLKGIADADNNGEVTLDEWYVFFEGVISDTNKLENFLQVGATQILSNIDSDGDGQITLEDYKEFIFSFNKLGKKDAETAFKKLDTNGDGAITPEELKNHFRDFYVSTDENTPGNWLLGGF
jgi:Ca2+-binding EF-hand superfamily protein